MFTQIKIRVGSVVVFALSLVQINAQTMFQTSFSNAVYMCGRDIKVSNGYYYIGGTSKQPTISNFLLMKTYNNGDSVWSREFHGNSPIEGRRVILRDSFIYLIGNCNPGTSSTKGFIAKTTENGSIIWSKIFGGTGKIIFNDAVLADDSTIVVTGTITGTGAGEEDILVTVFSTSGTCKWSKTYGKSQNDEGTSIYGNSTMGYYLTGTSYTMDPDGDIFVLYISQDGTPSWCKLYNFIFSGYSNQNSYYLFMTNSDQLIISGNTKIYEFSPSDQVWNPLVFKTDLSGNVIYSKEYDLNSGGGVTYQVVETPDHYLVYCGYMRNIFGLLVKTSGLGMTQWSTIYGISFSSGIYNENITYSLAQDNNTYILTGFIQTPSDTSLYLLRTNSIGGTGCNEDVPPMQASPSNIMPTVNNLTISTSSFSGVITDFPINLLSPNASIYVYCETPNGVETTAKKLCIFPNPVHDDLQINGFTDNTRFDLTDEYGRLLKRGKSRIIDFRNYSPGIYFLTLYERDTPFLYKVIKMPY